MKIIYFDVETTGLDARIHSIHQLSGMVEINGKVVEEFNYHVQPASGKIVDSEALEVSGKTYEDLLGYEPSMIVFKKFEAMLTKYVDKFNKSDKFFLVGYNSASFDNQFLREWFIDHALNENSKKYGNYFGSWFWANPIDVYVLASFFTMKQRSKMSDGKLGTMALTFGFEIDESRLHDGLYDVTLTRGIYMKIKEFMNGIYIGARNINEVLDTLDAFTENVEVDEVVKVGILEGSQNVRSEVVKILKGFQL